MRWSKYFIPTLKESPSDADVASHRLLVRSGCIRQVTAGVYAWLPLGHRALERVAEVVRQEMNRAGAMECSLAMLSPASLWEETGRGECFGETLFRIQGRDGRPLVLGPTHEEIVTDIVRSLVASYRQLPLTLYQIATKFRDELRPSGGVLRTREFLMKDAYSFDATLEGARQSFDRMHGAYCRIFSRLGLTYVIAEAESGAIGGDINFEFMVPSEVGEDSLMRCHACGYTANSQRAGVMLAPELKAAALAGRPVPAPAELPDTPAAQRVLTPRMHTVDEVADFLKVSPERIAKTLVCMAPDCTPVFAMVRGDHELNLPKLERACRLAGLRLATPAEIEVFTGGPLGFTGPVGLKGPLYCDQAVFDGAGFVVGGNDRDVHLTPAVLGRDFSAAAIADLRVAAAGDPCPVCGSPLELSCSIEVGHIFNLGTHYSKPMRAVARGEDGVDRPVEMGCYGIGISRVVAAIVETHHDESGIVWPIEAAPFEVELIDLSGGDEAVHKAAEGAYRQLNEAGIDVLYDDRDLRAGVKFKDADLVGAPIRVAVGQRSMERGVAEVKLRRAPLSAEVPLAAVVERVLKLRGELYDELVPHRVIPRPVK